MSIRDNLCRIEDEIDAACARAGRDPDEVHVVAVSKTVGVPQIREALSAGVRIIGENRVQEAWKKAREIGAEAEWHLVGHLQTNKVKRILEFADVIESVDSIHLADELEKRAEQLNRSVRIFVQVNTSGEESKFGVDPDRTLEFVHQLSEYKRLNVCGLMTIGAFVSDTNRIRACFQELNHLRDKVRSADIGSELNALSMGMTNDYPIAIEEGATHIRIGRALFGERKTI
jgi:hypothetical protein